MVKRRFYVSFVMLFSILTVLYCEAGTNVSLPVIRPGEEINEEIIKYYMRLNRLAEQKRYVELEAESQKFIDLAKKYNRQGSFDELIIKGYDFRALAQDKQGKYIEASNTIRDRHAWKPDPNNIEKVINYMNKHISQGEYFGILMEFTAFRIEKRKQVSELTREKAKLVEEYLQKKELTKDDLVKLQNSLKEINEKIRQINDKIEEARQKYNEEIKKYENLLLRQEQANEHRSKLLELSKINKEISDENKKVSTGLVEIHEKYKWSWNGLEETFKKLQELQKKIISLQNQILEFSKKTLPLSPEDKKKLQELREKLAEMLSEQEKLMANIEKAFMEADKFFQLPPDKQMAFFKLFKEVRETANQIAENTKKIDEFINKALIVYGDLNRDGKIDEKDIKAMKDLIRKPTILISVLLPPMPRLFRPEADLDGDGVITESDLILLKEYVYGDRKTFPVDPANLPGDINGNGIIDLRDLNTIVSVVLNPKEFPSWKVRLSDINKDGKVDFSDINEAIKKINEKREQVDQNKSIATYTTPIGTYTPPIAKEPTFAPASGPATMGETGTGKEATSLTDSF